MTTQEHLNKILEKCRAFLEIAGKRTPGEWLARPEIQRRDWEPFNNGGAVDIGVVQFHGMKCDDAAFIAACAGQAEAMARSTIAVCEYALMILQFHDTRPTGSVQLTELETAEAFARKIIAAWPDEIS